MSILTVTASPVERDVVWVGTEPSEVWHSGDAGATWDQTCRLETLPSSSEWSFPPRPNTHHVRWIACHPLEPERLWVAIEAGALVSTIDRGRTWRDRVPGGPRDTHELAIHHNAPDTLRVSAGDGYFESYDAGVTWRSPSAGLEVGYLRSVAIDPEQPEAIVVSASSHLSATDLTVSTSSCSSLSNDSRARDTLCFRLDTVVHSPSSPLFFETSIRVANRSRDQRWPLSIDKCSTSRVAAAASAGDARFEYFDSTNLA
jgi:hypothetical protein